MKALTVNRLSRLGSQGSRDSCLRFADGIAPEDRKTRFRLRTSLYRTELATRRATTEGSDKLLTRVPPPPGLAWCDTQHLTMSRHFSCPAFLTSS